MTALDDDADRQLDLLAELLVDAQHALVLTGAGVSTESGLPDYRGTNGLWRTRRFEELASIEMWRREPEEFWLFYAERLTSLLDAKPNTGHLAIAELERRGLVRRVLTQNVDGLHRAAGSRDPLELHGTLAEVECLSCGFRGSNEIAEAQLDAGVAAPACPVCAAILKPAVVLFGELLPPALTRAHIDLAACDLLICCGSSLQVYPVAGFPGWVHGQGGAIAIVNIGPTGADRTATVRLELETGQALPALVERVAAGPHDTKSFG
jgi:NAD-dependent deacetylase